MRLTTFTLTEDHIKLVRSFNIYWEETCYLGSPVVDPKRPYGNSSILNDIHELLTGETIGCIDSKRDVLNDREETRYIKLHRETEIALQIVLRAGSFKPGLYQRDEYDTNWRLVD